MNNEELVWDMMCRTRFQGKWNKHLRDIAEKIYIENKEFLVANKNCPKYGQEAFKKKLKEQVAPADSIKKEAENELAEEMTKKGLGQIVPPEIMKRIC